MTESRKIYLSSEEQYITWLYSKVGLGTREYGQFWRVIRRLFGMPFPVLVKRDINRVKDAENLRSDFAKEYHISPDFIVRRATVLEVLVAFSLRIQSDIMWDPENEDRAPLWFWTMLQNAGVDLEKFQDGYFNADRMIELENIVNRAVNREYGFKGEGGFFPLKYTRKNQRTTELWYQMQFWMDENYPI